MALAHSRPLTCERGGGRAGVRVPQSTCRLPGTAFVQIASMCGAAGVGQITSIAAAEVNCLDASPVRLDGERDLAGAWRSSAAARTASVRSCSTMYEHEMCFLKNLLIGSRIFLYGRFGKQAQPRATGLIASGSHPGCMWSACEWPC